MEVNPVMLPPGRARLSTSPSETGSDTVPQKNDGDRLGSVLSGSGVIRPGRDDHVNLESDQLIGQGGQPVEFVLSLSRLESYVLALDIAESTKLSPKQLDPTSG